MFGISRAFMLLGLIGLSSCSVIERFDRWVHEFSVKFRDEHHWMSTYKTWDLNDRYIEEVNFKNLSYNLGHNQFSGMTTEEYQKHLGFSQDYSATVSNRLRGSIAAVEDNFDVKSLPVSVDWIEKGAVTGVKDQGQCGSCWSFSTTGALEGAYFAKYGDLPSFAEQQLVDCDAPKSGGTDHGCDGGLMDNAFTWIGKNGGLCTETNYPYVSGVTQKRGTCETTCPVISKSKVSKFVDVAPSSDSAMMAAIAQQPVSIAIEADQKDFQMYKSGVFTGTCGTNLDHGVLVVGYGTLSGVDYYMVKNSWSTTWGSGGYIMLGRGSQYNKGDGQCGMLLQASYPVL